MTPEQTAKAVILDYAQELQHNDEPWREFECKLRDAKNWQTCEETFTPFDYSKVAVFRRKPRTITVTMPVPVFVNADSIHTFTIKCKTEADRDAALAAIREAMENNDGRS